jgi:hypothetical protein
MDVTEAEHALTNVLTGFSTTQNYVQTLAQNMEVQATMIYTYIYIILYMYISGWRFGTFGLFFPFTWEFYDPN